MLVLLAGLGVFVGFISGFFAIGGGTVLVPALLFLGYDIKYAIGISVTQMVFSSPLKKGLCIFKILSLLG